MLSCLKLHLWGSERDSRQADGYIVSIGKGEEAPLVGVSPSVGNVDGYILENWFLHAWWWIAFSPWATSTQWHIHHCFPARQRAEESDINTYPKEGLYYRKRTTGDKRLGLENHAAWQWKSMLGLGSLWLHLGQAFGTSTKCVKHCSLRTPDICLEFAMF